MTYDPETYDPNYSDDERAQAMELALYLKHGPEVVLRFDAFSAYTLAGALMLACRHPMMAPGAYFEKQADLMHDLVDRIAAGLGGVAAETIEAGWDPANDR